MRRNWQSIREKTGLDEAVVTGKAPDRWDSQRSSASVTAGFLMGSMGQVVGEKITRAVGAGHQREAAGDPVCLFRRSPDAGRDRSP